MHPRTRHLSIDGIHHKALAIELFKGRIGSRYSKQVQVSWQLPLVGESWSFNSNCIPDRDVTEHVVVLLVSRPKKVSTVSSSLVQLIDSIQA